MRTHVDLFSGIGGFALAARWAGVETIAFAEIDPYASRVIERHFPGVRNYGDVRNVPAIAGTWLLTGGSPCQDTSIAGQRKGKSGDRYLWPQMAAAVERFRPAWVVHENVTNVTRMVLHEWHADLEMLGYQARSFDISAACVGLSTMERHIWTVAAVAGLGLEGHVSASVPRFSALGSQERIGRAADNGAPFQLRESSTFEPKLLRTVKGVSARVDRVRCLGNAIPPPVAYQLIKRMIEAEEA